MIMDSLARLGGVANDMLEDPKQTFYNVLLYGLDKGKNFAMQELVIEPMIYKYLANGDRDAETYLKSYNVVESGGKFLNIRDSVFIDSDGDIVIVAEYEIDYALGLGVLPLPDAMKKISVKQTAKTSAWLGGNSDE